MVMDAVAKVVYQGVVFEETEEVTDSLGSTGVIQVQLKKSLLMTLMQSTRSSFLTH